MAESTVHEDDQIIESKAKDIPKEEVTEAIELAKAAKFAQDAADKFKSLASAALDPHEREKYLRQAYEKEIEARGNSKRARALASGWGQGAINGGGIGAVVGGGLGTVVGTLVGSIVALPTTALGMLGGTAVGAIHGPWVKFPRFVKNEKGTNGASEGKVDEGEETPEYIDENDEEAHQAVLRAAQQAEDLQKGNIE